MSPPEPYYHDASVTVYCGDVVDVLPRLEPESVHCCITSPPYWGLRDYGVDGQFGLESTPDEYVAKMVAVFREVRRVLRSDGTLWMNLGDSYSSGGRTTQVRDTFRDAASGKQEYLNGTSVRPACPHGMKQKDLVGIPWRVALALQADGWYLRQDLIWHKPNPMPESVTDRCTKAHEYIFLLSKSARYYWDAEAVREPQSEGTFKRFGKNPTPSPRGPKCMEPNPWIKNNVTFSNAMKTKILEAGRNKRSVWTIPTEPYAKAHFATYPRALVRTCLLAGCPAGGTVLDPFLGSGTTAVVARKNGCKCVGVELNPEYADMAASRLAQGVLPFGDHEEISAHLLTRSGECGK